MDPERERVLLSGCLLIGRLQERNLIQGGFRVNMPKLVSDLDQAGGLVEREKAINTALGLMRARGYVAEGDTVLDLLGIAYDNPTWLREQVARG